MRVIFAESFRIMINLNWWLPYSSLYWVNFSEGTFLLLHIPLVNIAIVLLLWCHGHPKQNQAHNLAEVWELNKSGQIYCDLEELIQLCLSEAEDAQCKYPTSLKNPRHTGGSNMAVFPAQNTPIDDWGLVAAFIAIAALTLLRLEVVW